MSVLGRALSGEKGDIADLEVAGSRYVSLWLAMTPTQSSGMRPESETP